MHVCMHACVHDAPRVPFLPHRATHRLPCLGRASQVVEVPPSDCAGRVQVLGVHTRTMPLSASVDLPAVAADCEGWSGAQLGALCREAAMCALRERLESTAVESHHFTAAARRVHGVN